MNPGVTLWLFHIDIPNVKAAEDQARENGDRIEQSFTVGHALWVIHFARIAIWYEGQAHL